MFFEALLNEYREWRDIRIKQAFENHEVDNEHLLQQYVSDDCYSFQDYESRITLKQYIQAQKELMEEGQVVENIVNEPLIMWCVMASSEDDWEALFLANKPQTDLEEEQEFQEESQEEPQA